MPIGGPMAGNLEAEMLSAPDRLARAQSSPWEQGTRMLGSWRPAVMLRC